MVRRVVVDLAWMHEASGPRRPTPPAPPLPEADGCGIPRFLGQGEEVAAPVALAAYPRSGTTLLRILLERLLGVLTGSDTPPQRHLSQRLRAMGLSGEGVVDGSVLVVKSHFPERLGSATFSSPGVLLLTRSPLQALESLFHMYMTRSHERPLPEADCARLSQLFAKFVRLEAVVWRAFHEYWLAQARLGARVCILRYEDLVCDTTATVARAATFLEEAMGVEPLRTWRERLAAVCGAGDASILGVYAPRSARVCGLADGACLRHLSKEDIAEALRLAGEGGVLQELGYGPDGAPLVHRDCPPARRHRCSSLLNADGAALIRPQVPGSECFDDAGFGEARRLWMPEVQENGERAA